ncbi:MAG: hypothetical protein HQK49_16365 [Oligoflexia bacterium]|nr:hypothetical protein [Oligoflexia bacterium]
MMIAFLVDQTQQIFCEVYRLLLEKCGSKVMLWKTLYSAFVWIEIENWSDLLIKTVKRL